MPLTFNENRGLFAKSYDGELVQKAFMRLKMEKDDSQVGYYKLPESSKEILQDLEKLQNATIEDAENIVVIGIGGSSLGTKAVDSMLKHKYPANKKLFFLENSDPINISSTLGRIEKENSVFILISKSGGTIETTSIFKTVLVHFSIDLKSEDKERVLIITDNGSPLSIFAFEYNIKSFNIPKNVGGRFSVLSAVGVVPLYLAGYDVSSLLEGANDMVENFFRNEEKHIFEKACFLYKNRETYHTDVMFAYSNSLENFSKWYVQLWGESLGKIDKRGNSVGLTPIGLTGSIDQHSFLQLVIEGPKDKLVTFISIEDYENDLKIGEISLKKIEKTDFINGKTYAELINAQCDSTMESLESVEVPTDKITFSTLNEKNCGRLMMYYQLLTSLVGAMMDINTYNQPGVELGKKILYKKYGQ